MAIDLTTRVIEGSYDFTLKQIIARLHWLGRVTQPEAKAVTVENPTSSEDVSLFFTDAPITITNLQAVLTGSASPSVTWTIRHGVNRNGAGAEVVTAGTTTTSITTGDSITAFNDATIVADSFVWLETTAKSGTVNTLAVTISYTED